ncbi:MAG: SDR family NAD(P)-dependent oxidoreductase [Spirochaetia bacterium]|nr:SDR family NAD(P)-dependent oxidoreductase [Spirochaetia bacterium]
MGNAYYLVIGGSSVAGQAAIAAVKEIAPGKTIVATSSADKDVSGADKTIHGVDLNQTDSWKKVVSNVVGSPEVLFFTPAFGPLGYPISETPQADVATALKFSYDPMIALHDALRPGLTVGFTAFFWLPHTLAAYGSMAYVKIAQERIAIAQPDQFKMIRAGTFRSTATRGIGLLLQRAVRDTRHEPIRKLGEAWKESGKKFGDFFFDFACESERRTFGTRFSEPHRQTNETDLKRAILVALSGEKAPIINVIGDWNWTDSAMPALPQDFKLL